ncbi:hypothetical protein ABT174_28685 [Streptomyces sparsogenes]|uniref:hypothetical protein n=1 Tax=Streptomyces sparsogenes TaxID=67365 RepID=UPI003323AC2D
MLRLSGRHFRFHGVASVRETQGASFDMVAAEDGSARRTGILVIGSLVMDRKFFAAGMLNRGAGRSETSRPRPP